MARTVEQIRQQITTVFVANMAAINIAVDPATWSAVNLFRLVINTVAMCQYILETRWDNLVADVLEILADLKPPSRRWYANKIKSFQFGFPLIQETDKFDNTGYTAAQIEASKVIKYVAVIKQINVYGRVKLRLKIAGSNGTDIVQLDDDVVTALTTWLDEEAAPAGDNYEVEARPNDAIKMKWRIYYDPLILKADGSRLDGTASEPVRDAIKSFLKDGIGKFSGTYYKIKHIDWVQLVPGVVIPEVLECSANYGVIPFTDIDTEYEPDGGWIRFNDDADLEIEFIPHNAI
jgi:hypothetical protein